jgi:predicted lipid-binding transport protein (Tim44 family)
MKLSWNSLKISIAGAKLSHLVQKDKIWDHGSMAEQARIVFYLVQKTMINGNMDSLKKYLTASCFENLEKE